MRSHNNGYNYIFVVPAILVLTMTFAKACQNEVSKEEIPCDFYFNSWEATKQNQGATGQYWYLAENEALIFLTTEEAGLHEVGHFVDMERDYPSESKLFQDAVYEYLFNLQVKDDKLHHYIFVAYSDGRLDDTFAQLYMYALIGAHPLPTIFEEFFE